MAELLKRFEALERAIASENGARAEDMRLMRAEMREYVSYVMALVDRPTPPMGTVLPGRDNEAR